jgi:hypothetical protein
MTHNIIHDVACGLAAIYTKGMPRANVRGQLKEFRKLGGRGDGLAIAFALVRQKHFQPMPKESALLKLQSKSIAQVLGLVGWPIPPSSTFHRS